MSFKQRILFFSLILGSFHFHVKAQRVLETTNAMMGGGGMPGGMGGMM